ncbi:hypothetical protein HELRODRAFT_92484 [Helobdella robusta]|uniref:Fatty acid hydroxylase domain-containing protein n=1 Tax=Helobdella robusta TaxID=6412 RepID=T1G8H2_HELRO|nr:hypothetical protein HELRODRAFT_92484 [Helobdella robusta]ESO04503.1 hypothetical protein HELRODRAFT_92484 [Helobdella robusta]
MDVVLKLTDDYFFTPYIYGEKWLEDYWLRQFISLNLIATCGGYLLYLIVGSFSYIFIFNKDLLRHPLTLKNQPWLEMCCTFKSLPVMGFLSAVVFLLEVRGHSKLYDSIEDSKFGAMAIVFSSIMFILFTDCLIYFIHKYLHHPLIYSTIHKPHHKWKVTTPFASHSFHPIDGFSQSLPYHIYVFLFPMHKFTYLILYILVNIWSVSIHDGDYRIPVLLQDVINGAAHHTDHHLFYNYNYGQYFTFWDRVCGTYKTPSAYQGNGPLTCRKNEK